MKRYRILDGIRGFALFHMAVYHFIWDLVYLFGWQISWYKAWPGYFWQQSICSTFILLSGFCFPLGKKKLKRGSIVFAAGCMIMAVTEILMPEDRVMFGVLTLLGSCMLLMIPLDSLLQGKRPKAGLAVSFSFFVLLRNINEGYGGIGNWRPFQIPVICYQNLFTAYLGFPPADFYSSDYFSLLPWLFLFLFGYYLYYYMKEKNWLIYLEKGRCTIAEWIGRHSLLLYLLHQPVILLFLRLFL